VFFSGDTGTNLAPHKRRIGFVFQDLALWPHLSALGHVRLVGRPFGMTDAQARALLESVGLVGLESRRPGQLSGGEQQRLAIARALAGSPSMLLLDEPFASVDRQTRQALYELLRQVSPLVSGPTIYVTHQKDDAISLAEAVVTIEAGRLAQGGHPWDEDPESSVRSRAF
jgi:ABC-type sulfate/molybdate transport systems ATPase subunit